MKNILLISCFLFTTYIFSQVRVNDPSYNPLDLPTNIKSINFIIYDFKQEFGDNVENISRKGLVERYYDSNNNLIKEVRTNTSYNGSDDPKDRVFVFKYESNKLKESTKTVYFTSIVTNKRTHRTVKSKYDSNKNIINQDYYDDEGSQYRKII